MLADFVAEFATPDEKEVQDDIGRWTKQIDGSLAQKRRGVGVIIIASEENVLKYGVKLQFPSTNNEVEYEAVLTRLKVGKSLGTRNLLLQSDSKLAIGQIKGEYEAKENRMQKYLRLTDKLTQEFDQVDFTQVPKNQNSEAD